MFYCACHAQLVRAHNAVFFNLFSAAEPHTSVKSLTEPHALIRESSDVREVEATGYKLQTHFLSRAEPP